jgi:phage terminase large subunit GpA-like protein
MKKGYSMLLTKKRAKRVSAEILRQHRVKEKLHHRNFSFKPTKPLGRHVLPKSRPPVSEWAETHVVVPSDAPVPGKYRNELAPWLSGIMDATMFESVREVVVCAPDQSGKTQLGINLIGYTADRIPGNWLIVYPSEAVAGSQNRDRVRPLFKDSPKLRRYMTRYADDSTSLQLRLRNLKIYMAWATSAPTLKTRPLPYTLEDEIDEYPLSAHKRVGSVHDLIMKRSRNFRHMSKNIRISTPTIPTWGIWKALTEDAQVVYEFHVQCPLCEARHKMSFEHIKWDGGSAADYKILQGNVRSVWYECPSCQGRWLDAERDTAVLAGRWYEKDLGTAIETSLRSKKPSCIGFQYPAWIMRNVPLRDCAAAFVRARQAMKAYDLQPMKNFQNSFAVEPWEQNRRGRKVSVILAHRSEYPEGLVPGPGKVVSLTFGADVQDYSLWYEIRAWGPNSATGIRDYESWTIRAGEVLTFEDLERILWATEYRDSAGNLYPIEWGAIDSAGHRTNSVYAWVGRHFPRVIPSIGRQSMTAKWGWGNTVTFPGTNKTILGAPKLLLVNTKHYKDELAQKLVVPPGDPGGWRFYDDYPESFAEHLTSEFVNDKGVWECPPSRPNHLFDCAVLSLVSADIRNVFMRKTKINGFDRTPQRREEPEPTTYTPQPGSWCYRD